MNINGVKVKEIGNADKLLSNYIKIGNIRKRILTYLGWISVIAIIGQFISYSFGTASLYTLFLLVSWFFISVVINWIFNPIMARSYLKETGASLEEIKEYSFGNQIKRVSFKRSWFNIIVLIAGAYEIFKIINDHIDMTHRVSGRYASVYVMADFQNTILILIATIAVVVAVLYFNRKK